MGGRSFTNNTEKDRFTQADVDYTQEIISVVNRLKSLLPIGLAVVW